MRDAFLAIVSGWTLVDDDADLHDRINLTAMFKAAHGLEPDEEATVKLMIRTQIARGVRDGHFEPFISSGMSEEELRKMLDGK